MNKVLLVSVLVVLLLAVAVTVAAAAVSNANSLTGLFSPNPQAPTVSSGISIESVSPAVGAAYDSSSDGSNPASQTWHDQLECHHHADAVSSDSSPSY